MLFSQRVRRAVSVMSLSVLAACGGGGGGAAAPVLPAPAPVVPGPVVGTPVPPISAPAPVVIDTATFAARARVETCSDIRSRLFVIDSKMVLFDRAGNCPDNGNAQVLHGANVETVLCQAADSIAGPVTSCKDEGSRALFDTMRKNLDKADLGLGAGHTVKPVEFLPKDGTVIGVEVLVAGGRSAIAAPKQVVVRDEAALAKLWAEHNGNLTSPPALPKVDFTTRMVLAVFAGEDSGSGCHSVVIRRVVVSGDKLVAEVERRDIGPGPACIAAQTSPVHLVSVKRSDAQVEFKALTGIAFVRLASGNYSWHNGGQPANLVIKDAAAYLNLHPTYANVPNSALIDPVRLPVLPAVDFSRDMVIAVFMGSMPSGCYGIGIQSIYKGDAALRVSVLRTEPGRDAICTLAFTYPFDIVVLPRSDLSVEFESQTRYVP